MSLPTTMSSGVTMQYFTGSHVTSPSLSLARSEKNLGGVPRDSGGNAGDKATSQQGSYGLRPGVEG